MEGGLTWSEINRISKKDFLWLSERLVEQKKKESDEMEKARRVNKPSTSTGSKYLNASNRKRT
jgi:hypothetical protein